MASYTVTDGTTVRDVLDISINESTNNLDECVILTDGKYTDNITLTFYDDSSTEIFNGLLKGSEQRDDYDVMYNLTAMERAVEMQYVIMSNGVKTGTATSIIQAAIDAVNTAYGYTGADQWTIDSGSGSSTSLSIGCYYTNALALIRKVAVDNLGLKLWFESSTRKVYFRTHYNDLSGTALVYTTKRELRDSNKRGCTKVTIIGSNTSIVGSSGSGSLIRVFEYPTATTVTECETLAAKILADLQNTSVKWEVVLEIGASIQVADLINLDGTNYVVDKKVTTFQDITITTGPTTVSILDTLGSSITEVSGETVTGSDASWSGDSQNLPNNTAAGSKWYMNVKDINTIGDTINLTLNIDKYRTSSTASTTTDYLSDVDTINSTSESASDSSDATTNYIPSSSGLTLSSITDGFQHGYFCCDTTLTRNGAGYVYIYGEVDDNSSFTSPTTVYTRTLYTGTGTIGYKVFSGLFSGTKSSSELYFRVRIYSSATNRWSHYNLIVDRIPRHLHTVPAQTNTVTEISTPPTNVYLYVNSTLVGAKSNGSVTNIKSYLTNGQNTIEVRVGLTADMAAVSLSAAYQTLGKS